ncbi:MAG: Holliday junction resolvase RuvX [Cyanobacteria bacterium P01_H01_bin.15]
MRKPISALGLDVGQRRIGVAGCDGTGLIATGLTTIKRGKFPADVVQFQELVIERAATILVVGFPYTLDGDIGKQADRVRHYAERLARALNLPIEYVDERLTSVEAEAQLKQQCRHFSPRRDKAAIDRQAAQIILQQWLNQRRENRVHTLSQDELNQG